MSGFITKLKTKCAKLIYRTAAARLAIEEGIPFRTFEQPLFRRLFTPLNHESDKIVKLHCNQVRDAVLEMAAMQWRQLNKRSTTITLLGQQITGKVKTKQLTPPSLRTGSMTKLGC
jgi:hypothetical protein